MTRWLIGDHARYTESISTRHNSTWYGQDAKDSSVTIDMYIQLFPSLKGDLASEGYMRSCVHPSYIGTELIVLDTHLYAFCTRLEEASRLQPYPDLQQREVACLQVLENGSGIRAS